MRYFPKARRAPRSLPSPVSNDGRNAVTWVDIPASEHTKRERRRSLAYWLLANKLWTGPAPSRKGYVLPIFKGPAVLEHADKAIDRIRRGLMDPIASANRCIEYLKENNMANSTILGARCNILLFLRFSRLGLDPEDLRIAVKRVPRKGRVLAAKLPTRDQIRSLLLSAPLKTKLLISMLISTGARIGEVRRVKVSDVDFAQNPVQVYFRETKTGPTRIGFLSSETVEILRQYLKVRKIKHEYVFEGYDPTKKGEELRRRDNPIHNSSSWLRVRRVLRQVEMNQRSEGGHYYFHPHTFRVLSLALMKGQGGLPSDWAEYLVGHSIGTAAAYLPTTEDLAKEWSKIQDRFCFLTVGPQTPHVPPPTKIIQEEEIPRSTEQSHVRTRPHEVAHAADKTTHRWASNTWLFVKVDMHNTDFDQALADGFSIYDSDGASLRLLRKRKTPFVAERSKSGAFTS